MYVIKFKIPDIWQSPTLNFKIWLQSQRVITKLNRRIPQSQVNAFYVGIGL